MFEGDLDIEMPANIDPPVNLHTEAAVSEPKEDNKKPKELKKEEILTSGKDLLKKFKSKLDITKKKNSMSWGGDDPESRGWEVKDYPPYTESTFIEPHRRVLVTENPQANLIEVVETSYDDSGAVEKVIEGRLVGNPNDKSETGQNIKISHTTRETGKVPDVQLNTDFARDRLIDLFKNLP